MKARCVLIVVVMLFFAGCVSSRKAHQVVPEGIVSLPQARSIIKEYYEGGDFYRDVKEKTAVVAEAVDQAIADKVKYPAVVMVVEDVLLSTYQVRKSQGFSTNDEARKSLDSHVILSALPSVKPSIRLYNYLLSRNVPVFLVSYRPESFRIQIMDNLVKVGFAGWNKIFMYPAAYPDDKNFCEEVRKGLQKTGFNIVATVGVLKEDVSGDAAGVKVLYPNYIYDQRWQ